MYKDVFSALATRLGYEEETLRYIINRTPDYYHPFHLITSKNNKQKTRHIDSPGKKSVFRQLQKKINIVLLQPEIGLLPVSMVGSVKKKQLFEHILPHINQPTVVCMDLENCFPSISQSHIFNVWHYDLGYSNDLSKVLKKLTTIRGYLPQGPPTSPLLCNFALSKMSSEIATLCNANDLTYTQYVDDICISGDDNIVRAVIGQIHKITSSYGHSIKDIKTEIMDQRHQQRSAGVILNQQPRLLKSYRDKIVSEVRVIQQRGIITSGEKLHIVGEILHLRRFSKADADRIGLIFNSCLQKLAELDQRLPKPGNVKPCYPYIKNRYSSNRCKYV